MTVIVERTCYYARPGCAEEVLRTRRRASDIRARLGLPRGTITVKADPAGDGPDVAWECAFPDPEAHARDLAARAASPEFEAIRAVMTGLLARFERQVARRDDPPAAIAVDAAGPVPREVRFPSRGRPLAGYLFTPPGPGPFPCVVTNHGRAVRPGSGDVCRPGTAALLLSWGYAAFLPHRRGYGNSPGPAWREEVTGAPGTPEHDDRLARRLAAEAEDVAAAVDFLAARGEAAADRLALLGGPLGGTVALLAGAAVGERVRCVVDLGGAARSWERSPALRETLRAAAGRLRAPILLVQAENDYSTAPTRELAAELARRGHPHAARVYPPFGLTAEEGHRFARDGAPVWGAEVRGFLDRWTAAR